jgi:hypothetical protein
MNRAQRIRGTLKLMIAAAGFAGLLIGPGRTFSSEWNVMPDPQHDNQPGVERAGTLRIVRFTGDWDGVMHDQGTLLGWTNAAVNGKVEPMKTVPARDGTLIDVWQSEEMQKK